MRKRLRYADLVEIGVVKNRVTLANWIRDHGFPRGQLTGPNSRTWDEGEIEAWLANRPIEPKPTPSTRRRHRRPVCGTSPDSVEA
jgi:hypothetical protein